MSRHRLTPSTPLSTRVANVNGRARGLFRWPCACRPTAVTPGVGEDGEGLLEEQRMGHGPGRNSTTGSPAGALPDGQDDVGVVGADDDLPLDLRVGDGVEQLLLRSAYGDVLLIR